MLKVETLTTISEHKSRIDAAQMTFLLYEVVTATTKCIFGFKMTVHHSQKLTLPIVFTGD